MRLFYKTIQQIGDLDAEAMTTAQEYIDSIVKPQGSLGKLEDIARQVAGITGQTKNRFEKKVVMVMCADNGITDEGVASCDRLLSTRVANAMVDGGAGVSVLAKLANADVHVVDVGLETDSTNPKIVQRKVRAMTSNFLCEHAMTREEAIRAVEVGMQETLAKIEDGYSLFGTGEMGIGNTTTSSAILYAFTKQPLDILVGRGAGLTDEALQRKKDVIAEAVSKHKPNPDDPIDVVAKVGGFDLAALAGVYLACAAARKPVLIDGFISGAAAVLACRISPEVRQFMFPSHGSVEPGFKVIMDELKMSYMLDMNMRLGEGTGCALAFHLMDAAMSMMNEQILFKDLPEEV